MEFIITALFFIFFCVFFLKIFVEILPFLFVIGAIGGAIYFASKELNAHKEEKQLREAREADQRKWLQEQEERKRREEERERQEREAERKRRQDEFLDGFTKELRSIEVSIKTLSERLNVVFSTNYYETILHFTETHRHENLSESRPLEKLLMEQTRDAKDVQHHLQQAHTVYAHTDHLYSDVVREVNKTGSIPLIKELEHLYGYMTSTNLKSLLIKKQWKDFEEILASIGQELERLKQTAIKYQHADSEYEETAETLGKMNEEKAYDMLGISPNLSNEEIKKVFYKLSQIYHPDAKLVEDDTRFKDISEAYNFLKERRGIK